MKTYKVVSKTLDPWGEVELVAELVAEFTTRKEAEEFLANLPKVLMLKHEIYEHEPVDNSEYTVF